MKRYLIVFIIIFVFLNCKNVSYADSVSEGLPDGVIDYLPSGENEEECVTSVDGSYMLSLFAELLLAALKRISRTSLKLFGIILFCNVIDLVFDTFDKKNNEIFSVISNILISLSVYSVILDCFEQFTEYLTDINSYMSSLSIVMSGIYLSGGNTSSAVVNASGVSLMMLIVEKLCISYLLPLLKICFAISVASSVSGTRLDKISRFIRNVFTSIIIILMTVITITLAFQTSIASSADSVAVRSLKFAALKYIPIIGGGVGESLRNISAGLKLTKNITSSFGIIVILIITLLPLAHIFAVKISLSLVDAFSAITGVKCGEHILNESIGILNFMIAIISVISITFIITVSLFISVSLAISI